MRTVLFRLAHALMGIIACAWPLGVYQDLPLTGVSVVSVAGGALVVLWAIDLIAHRTPRIPFELFWPAVLVAALAVIVRFDHAWTIVGVATVFVAALHFARDRQSIERWLVWSASACLIAALADIAYRVGYGWPAAYAIPANAAESPRVFDAISATSGSLGHGSTVLIAGALIWIVLASRAEPLRPVFAVCFLATMGALGFQVVGLLLHGAGQGHAGLRNGWVSWLIGGLAAWLVARIAAKVWIERARRPDGSYALVVGPLAAIALVAPLEPNQPMAWHAWAAALAAGYVMRDKRPAPEVTGSRFGAFAILALLPFVAVNAYFIDSANEHDGRNYAQDLRADYSSGAHAQLMARVEFWDESTGDGPAQYYWAALAALDADRPHAAAAWSNRLSRRVTTHPRRHPSVSNAELEHLLNRFRDHVSALPERARGIAYERALSACGDAEAAEASLRQRIAGANPVYEEIERAPLQHAVEFLFQDVRAQIDFSDWSIAELIAVLDLIDARVETAPPEIDRSWLPASVAVRRDARALAIAAESLTSRASGSYASVCRFDRAPAEFAEDRWRTAALPFDASWQITLHSRDEDALPLLTVTISEDGVIEVLLPEEADIRVPDEPAVLVWLP